MLAGHFAHCLELANSMRLACCNRHPFLPKGLAARFPLLSVLQHWKWGP